MSLLPQQNIYPTHPDDKSTKEVSLQISGGSQDKHALLWWRNAPNVVQIVQLSGSKGNFAYITPIAFPLASPTSPFSSSTSGLPGTVDARQQVRYEKGWMVNGPRVWMRDLLLAMVGVGLIP
ncbi:hypothetical protein BDQ17DRAFT_1342505, partial [Cyathus striatus]